MRIFSALYEKTLRWAAHPHAARYLAGLSFAESSFFPIPPDVMLAPMSLATPQRAWFYAGLTTVASVLGGAAGYIIGLLAFDVVEPLLHRMGYWDEYLQAQQWFARWGFWAVLLAGFSPIPYKVFTIAAGVVALYFPIFLVASLIGRGARFWAGQEWNVYCARTSIGSDGYWLWFWCLPICFYVRDRILAARILPSLL